jgi:hypothetical protein
MDKHLVIEIKAVPLPGNNVFLTVRSPCLTNPKIMISQTTPDYTCDLYRLIMVHISSPLPHPTSFSLKPKAYVCTPKKCLRPYFVSCLFAKHVLAA